MMRHARRLGAAVAAAAVFIAPLAQADEIDRCLAAHPEAQRLRLDGKLRAARADLLVCARETCPSVVRAECGRWLGEVDALLPSIVVSARTSTGADLTGARVIVDGEPFAGSLDGRPFTLDPGPHKIRVEASGYAPAEETALLSEGDKARALVFTLALLPPMRPLPSLPMANPSPILPAGSPVEASPPGSPENGRPVPVTAYVAGGVALAGVVSFASFGLVGRAEYFDLKRSCAPACTSAQDSPVQTKLVAADISLGVTIAALAAGLTFYLSRPSRAAETTRGMRLHFTTTGRGASAAADWTF